MLSGLFSCRVNGREVPRSPAQAAAVAAPHVPSASLSVPVSCLPLLSSSPCLVFPLPLHAPRSFSFSLTPLAHLRPAQVRQFGPHQVFGEVALCSRFSRPIFAPDFRARLSRARLSRARRPVLAPGLRPPLRVCAPGPSPGHRARRACPRFFRVFAPQVLRRVFRSPSLRPVFFAPRRRPPSSHPVFSVTTAPGSQREEGLVGGREGGREGGRLYVTERLRERD